MSTRPRLVRSIPFWLLVAASLTLTAVGAWLVSDRVARIQDGVVAQTAEGAIEVYAGPSIAIAGAVVLGAGLVGLVLALAVAAASTLRPHAAVEIVEVVESTDPGADAAEPAGTHGYQSGLGYTEAIDTTPTPDAAPADGAAPEASAGR
jgi:hypothetical protein